MSILIWLFTFLLILDSLVLILLVLIQLPKKEAGMGQAFGGAATDALFGAGSGNVLTKVTKWSAGIFFALAILLTILGTYKTTSSGGGRLQKLLQETKTATPLAPAPAATPGATNAAKPGADVPAGTPIKLEGLPTNAPAAPAK